MLPPNYINSLPDALVDLYSQVEADILADMARRIKEYDYWIPAAQHQAVKLREMGMAREEILKRLSSLTGKNQKELKRLMKEAGVKTIRAEDTTYKAAGMTPPSPAESAALQKTLNAGLKRTTGTFKNLTKTTANTASRQFENALDRAWLQITSGAFDYNTAVRMAIKDLSRAGVGAIKYPSGHVDNLEVAVRRAAITGVNQTQGELVEARRQEMGCNLVEVSAHAGARPDHVEWQGGIYWTIEKDPDYPQNFTDTCGYGRGDGIYGWNCSHSHRAYVKGMPRTYTKKMLEEYDAKNYEYNGKKMSEYEANQQQRYIERQIRRWKRENMAMKAAGQDTSESSGKIKQWQDKQRDFLKQTGLKRQSAREKIPGVTWNGGNGTIGADRQYKRITEDHHEKLMEMHRANVTDAERKSVMGFNWETFRNGNLRYGYINTENSEMINKAIREGNIHSLPRQSQQTIKDLRRMIKANTIDEDLMVSRYVNEEWVLSQFGRTEDIADFIKNGKAIQDNQFVSCSLTDAAMYSNRAVKLEISVPKGTNAYVSENRMESEMILYKPAYNVKSVIESAEGQLIIQCEVI